MAANLPSSDDVGGISERVYIGVVAGGYEDPIGTGKFRVTVHAEASSRFRRDISIGTIVRVDTDTWRGGEESRGDHWQLTTYGIIEDINVLPGYAFADSKHMAQSVFYQSDEFKQSYSSTGEDALELIVRSLGHERHRGESLVELYGPVRPPERESAAYLATPQEVGRVILRPIDSPGRFRIGAYSTAEGIYDPVTPIALGREQLFLHGALIASSGWGKTVAIKHLIQEALAGPRPPAVIAFNIKGFDFYDLEKPLQDDQQKEIESRNHDMPEVWREFRL